MAETRPTRSDLDRETPSVCPECGEEYTHVIPDDVNPHVDADGNFEPAEPLAPIEKTHVVGKQKDWYPGWKFIHTEQDGDLDG